MSENHIPDDGKRNIWQRGLLMLLFVLIYAVAEIVIYLVALFQFFHVAIAKRTNRQAMEFGHSLSRYVYLVFTFMTFNSEQLPFPFDDWPRADTTA